MARLNVEDDFFVEVESLYPHFNNQDEAYGHALRWLRAAQQKHKSGKVFTEDEFKGLGFRDVLFPFFAKRTPSGIEAKGSEKHFSWLEQKIEAGRRGGKKSAQRPRDENGQFVSKSNIHQAEPKREPSTHQASSSSSSSSSLALAKLSSSASSSEIHNAMFQEKLLQTIFDALKQIYGTDPPVLVRRSMPRILATFGDPESFASWSEGVINAKNCPDPKENFSAFSRYYQKSLSDALGGKL